MMKGTVKKVCVCERACVPFQDITNLPDWSIYIRIYRLPSLFTIVNFNGGFSDGFDEFVVSI